MNSRSKRAPRYGIDVVDVSVGCRLEGAVNEDWRELRRRTTRVRAALPDAPATPLSEAEVVEAEGQFGVTLPAGYREFLIHVDSGGHGPDSGLRRLRSGPSGWGWEGWPDEPGTDLDA